MGYESATDPLAVHYLGGGLKGVGNMSAKSDYARFFGRELATVRDELLAYPDTAAIWALPRGFPTRLVP